MWVSQAQARETAIEIRMTGTMSQLSTVAVFAVLVVLIFGLANMMRDGSASLSQKLMRWRVGLQFVAVILLMAALLFKR